MASLCARQREKEKAEKEKAEKEKAEREMEMGPWRCSDGEGDG